MDRIAKTVGQFFHRLDLGPQQPVVVALSGGNDSTALLLALTEWNGLPVHAAHLDHRLDAGSRERARRAREIARSAGVPITVEHWRRGSDALQGRSVEAAAREARYAFLERVRQTRRGSVIATAHHLDDQAETVLLRLLYGSGIAGLAGIRPHWGRVVRPLLEVPRRDLERALAQRGVRAEEDPTNGDLSRPRNSIRRLLLPYLQNEGLRRQDLVRLARSAAAATSRIDGLLRSLLQPEIVAEGVELRRQPFEALSDPLRIAALGLVHRLAGAPYPASSAARRELSRQLGSRHRVGCDCGAGWRWEGNRETLRLRRRGSGSSVFTYTLEGARDAADP